MHNICITGLHFCKFKYLFIYLIFFQPVTSLNPCFKSMENSYSLAAFAQCLVGSPPTPPATLNRINGRKWWMDEWISHVCKTRGQLLASIDERRVNYSGNRWKGSGWVNTRMTSTYLLVHLSTRNKKYLYSLEGKTMDSTVEAYSTSCSTTKGRRQHV